MSETSTVGNRVRDLRVKAGLTKVKLAKLCGCSMPSIVNIENGRTKQIRYWLLEALAKNLGSTPQWIAYGSAEPPKKAKIVASLELSAEYRTEVFIDAKGGIVLRQDLNDGADQCSVYMSASRARLIGASLIDLANSVEGRH